MIEQPSALAEYSVYSPDRPCHGTIARIAAPCQAFHDSALCLLHATTSRRARHWSSDTGVKHFPGSSMIEQPSALAEYDAYSPDRPCHGTLARIAALCQAFHDDSAFCLLRTTTSRRARHRSTEEAHRVNTILIQLHHRHVSAYQLND